MDVNITMRSGVVNREILENEIPATRLIIHFFCATGLT
jgi:hypothetical protein